jgi:NTP pyrophosphatase (non-canonical NTP hydrolase)
MKGDEFEQLLRIAQRKNAFDQSNTWANGSETYFAEIRKELIEAEEELNTNDREALEEELGDVLWDYLNILLSLDKEGRIAIESVLRRSIDKFEERVGGIESGKAWAEVKAIQKARKCNEG